MGIKLFCGEPINREHEWDQLVEICEIIHQGYDQKKPIYLFYNFNLSKKYQIDLLVIQQNGVAILELKSYQGRITGDEKTKYWYVKNNKKTKTLPSNLFQQLEKQRNALIKKLKEIRKKSFPHIKEIHFEKVKAWG